jgi:hypothetical protein
MTTAMVTDIHGALEIVSERGRQASIWTGMHINARIILADGRPRHLNKEGSLAIDLPYLAIAFIFAGLSCVARAVYLAYQYGNLAVWWIAFAIIFIFLGYKFWSLSLAYKEDTGEGS